MNRKSDGGCERRIRGQKLSIVSGEALTVLSTSSDDDCCRVMNLLQAYNLDLPHYDHAIHAAAVEQNWTEAARLFRQKIDPDLAPWIPVAHPLGLYAIAKHAQREQEQEQEESNDLPILSWTQLIAVMSLTMVSRSRQV